MQKSQFSHSKIVFGGLLISSLFVYACEDTDDFQSDRRNGGISVEDPSNSKSKHSNSTGGSATDSTTASSSSDPSVDDENSEEQSDQSVGTKPGEHGDCIHHKAWWKTHSRFAKGKNNHRPWPLDEDTELCEQTWYEIMWTPPKGGNPWYKLAYQWIAASLNVANGAMPTPEVETAIAEAELRLAPCALEKSEWKEIHDLEKLLHSFNQGHTDSTCDEGEDTEEGSTTGEDTGTDEDSTKGEDTGTDEDSITGEDTGTEEDSTSGDNTGTEEIPPAP